MPTFESEYRKIVRWFSKQFSTPIRDVEEMDVHYVLLHHFEEFIQHLEPEEYNKYKRELLYKEVVVQEEKEDDDWLNKEIEELKKAQKELSQTASKPESTQDKLNLPDALPEGFDVEF